MTRQGGKNMRTSYAAILVALLTGCSESVPTENVAATAPAGSAAAQPAAPRASALSPPRPRRLAARPSAKPSFRRWAIISSGEARQDGLGDLVTAELSKSKDLELVERDRLEMVTKELRLAAAMESQAAATRLKMGQLLKADALLFLSIEGDEKARALKLVVSDSLFGARLRIEYLPCGRSPPADLARHCADIVADVRMHFAGGIRQIVGVSPLLSKNLVHNYDQLQVTYAKLLEAALTAAPNVAVIEIEEVRAIGRELLLTGAALADRPTPLLVEGEYSVSQREQEKPEVQFEFTCQAAGGQRRTVRPPPIPLSASARFIINDLPPQLLPRKGGEPNDDVSVDEQFQWLVARGEAFSQVGAWEQGMELLEAAVLLSPDDLNLRLKLMDGYYRFLVSRRDWISGRPDAVVRTCLPPMIKARLAYLGHVEYLIHNRRLNGIQAVAAVCTPFPFYVWPLTDNLGAARGSAHPFQDLLQPVAEAEERFMAEVYPQVLQFPTGRRGENPEFTAIFHEDGQFGNNDVHTAWIEGLVSWFVKERAYCQFPTAHDLDFLSRLMIKYVPGRCRTSHQMIAFLTNRGIMRNFRQTSESEAPAEDDWIAFLGRLAESKNRMVSLYGRFALLNRDHETRLVHIDSRELTESLLARVEAWLKDYAAMDSAEADRNGKARDALYNSVDQMRRDLDFALKQPVRVAAGPKPAPVRPRPATTPAASQFPPAAAKLTFEEIDLRGFKSGGFDHVLACGDKCDLLWRNDALAIIREKGTATEILPKETRLHNACWDGSQIWIGTTHQGLWVLSTDGRIVAKIGPEKGLPPAERAMVLHALEPGKVCAAGSFGEHSRAWCAMVELRQTDAKVNVFFSATHVPPNRSSSDKDPEQVFRPSFFCDFDPGNGGPPLLLLDRDMSVRVPPLAIDRATLKVSELNAPRDSRFARPGRSFRSRNGGNLEISGIAGGDIMELAQPGTQFDDGTTARRLEIHDAANGPPLPVAGTCLLEYRRAIYVPGIRRNIGYMRSGAGRYVPRFNGADALWFRIDPETFRVETLELGPGYPNAECWYGVSNRYGLIGGCRTIGNSPARLFRVNVEEPEKGGAAADAADLGPDDLKPIQSGLLFEATSRLQVAAAGQVEMRIWTSADGESRVWARLVEATKDAVVLEEEGGARVTMPREKLSQADLDHLVNLAPPAQ
jgi:hypothetical protein